METATASVHTSSAAALLHTEEAIGFVKDTFARELARQLQLTKVSSPIAVLDGTGINDDLNGVERPVAFPIKALGEQQAVVVHSLAKWKRLRLMELGIPAGRGILTDMRALRPDEDYSPIHSIYVDQWDWEKHILPEQRTIPFLKETVGKIYDALRTTELRVAEEYPDIMPVLPEQITFIHAEELLQRYPTLTAKERETEAAKQYGAVFIVGIGGPLSHGEIHDGRAPDYDDWSTRTEDGFFGLNGDIVLWHPVLQSAFEVSSMGIRVDKAALLRQLEVRGCLDRKTLAFHQLLLTGQLTKSIGGGIGQSRVCMFMLRKAHIGEVQVSIWPEAVRTELAAAGVELL
ncbi:aspartate--ammonia ligase [Hymenobacter busanensis]|uniref:Aspartate--ammonia ligase n=1 Tax=Hymenobacter busanensis TaxID=2607656 RepID=A0A7L4ZSD6_9BACT|nr:aspartate--ammonia ligase [Hymenobacter busanensis]KAA9327669.1 aspartate--ammonia ligase [Hymenobacter busanensis]QHJ05991.1 aspartate--ammonia ligase [Hymenobacter busanensis]